jgi:hypothetical protein
MCYKAGQPLFAINTDVPAEGGADRSTLKFQT